MFAIRKERGANRLGGVEPKSKAPDFVDNRVGKS
jgi:hypothetical protein